MTSSQAPLILASASERRQRLLSEAGAVFETVIPDVEESDCSQSPRKTVQVNAQLKCGWAVRRHAGSAILAADTALEFEGAMIGKPADMGRAREQLRVLSGKTHSVLTGIALSFPRGKSYCEACESRVTFKTLTESMIEEYFSLVDPLDKAGAYDIGSHGDIIIAGYEGSLTNIIGLPMERVTELLKQNGYLQ